MPQRTRRKPRPAPRVSGWTARYALHAYLVVVGAGAAAAIALPARELRVGIGVIVVDVVMIATLIPLRRSRGLSASELGLRSSPPVKSVGLVVLAVVVLVVVTSIWDRGMLAHQPVTPVLATMHEDVLVQILGGAAAAVCAPVVEEIFFRGLLYRSFRSRMNIGSATVLAGALFGLAHATTYPLHTLPLKVAFGVIACLLYEYTGSLYPCIALHSFVDFTAFEFAISGRDRVALPVFLVLGASVLLYGGIRRTRARSLY